MSLSVNVPCDCGVSVDHKPPLAATTESKLNSSRAILFYSLGCDNTKGATDPMLLRLHVRGMCVSVQPV